MKKFLLVAALALVTMGASANNGVKSSRPFAKRTFKMTHNVVSGVEANRTLVSDFLESTKANTLNAKAVTRADEVALTPCYSVSSWKLSAGSFWRYNMYDRASYAFVNEDEVALQVDPKFRAVKGKVEKDVANVYSEDGADSITFYVDTIAYYGSTERVGLTLEPVDYAYNEAENKYEFSRRGAKTFGGYYFAEWEELYIPEVLGLYEKDSTEVFDELYTYVDLDLEPQANYEEYISKATISAQSYYTTETQNKDFDVEAKVLLGDGYFIVSNMLGDDEAPAWVRIALDSETSTYNSAASQYLDEGRFYTDDTRTTTQKGVIATYQTTSFSVTDNADETTTLATDGEDTYLNQVVFMEDNSAGWWDRLKMSINILYEPVADGIQSVGAESSAKFQNAIYNMAGQRVGKNFKGLVIKNGKKVVVK